ncbi:MAG TPA: leucyl aminopeptidase [Rubrobacteraceae bacterium]|nr:leucyl aminopeptidase [Rubrobacteraceae bacterium]
MIGIGAISDPLTEVSSGLLAISLHRDESPPEELREAVADILSNGDFSGKDGETALVYAPQGLAAPRLLLVGLGDRSTFTLDKLRRAAATAAKRAQALKLDDAAFVLRVTEGSAARVAAAEAAAEGAVLGAYQFNRHKTSGSASRLQKLDIVSDDKDVADAAQTGAKTAAATVLARDLANEPPNEATPEYLASKASEIAERYGMQVSILDRAGIEDEGLTGLATVGRSAHNEPRFIVLEHRKGGEEAPIVLVGKAVTFDSGGISIKPSGGMDEMKYDMSGGAAVLGAMEAVGALDLTLNVVALVPATENLPAGNAFKPGDVLKLHSGKTVEIVTTDAEGRLILADALSYAKRYEPAAVIDCATLTGACVVALGHHASGLMGNDEALIAEIQKAGEAAGERVWHLPLFEEYTEQTKGETADLKNSGGRPGGALTAGAFLKEFVDFPWAHLDIAGTAYGKLKNAYTPKGASGTPARLLVEFLRGRAGDRAVEVTR